MASGLPQAGAALPRRQLGYTSNPSEVSAEQVTAGMVDQTITITYQAIPGPKEGQQVVHYVNPDSKVVATQTITGKQGDDVPFTSQIPENWTPVNNVPSTIKITGGTTTILIKHKTTQASDSRTVTRTIVEELPSGPKTETQTATITRAGIKDLVTGEINWDPWTTSQWNKFTPEVPAGYIPSQRVVAQMQVAEKTQDTTVTITYTRIPEPQDGQQIISYQDRDGHVIHTQTVIGKDGDDVSFTPEVPTNWTPAGKVPTTVKIDGSTTVIMIEPKTSQVTDQKTITRKIIEHLSNGHDKTTMQRVTLKMTGIKNLVTGEVTDVSWTTGQFAAFTPEAVDGYTAAPASVAAQTVTADSTDGIVEINYTPNKQTGKISYVDGNGKEIGTTLISGKTGESVDVNPQVPTGWRIVPGQEIPQTVTVTPDGVPTVTIQIEHGTTPVSHTDPVPTDAKTPTGKDINGAHEDDLNRTVTRTIIVTMPDGQTTTTKQVAHIYRDAHYDDVTGDVTYGEWSTDSNAWQAYTPGIIAGYTPQPAQVSAATVTG